MFVRNTRACTTSSKLLPAALRTAERFWKTRSVSATMPPPTTLPVAGSWATCPLKKRKPSILTAWENGPTKTRPRSEEHTSELQSLRHLVCRLLLEKKKKIHNEIRNETEKTEHS